MKIPRSLGFGATEVERAERRLIADEAIEEGSELLAEIFFLNFWSPQLGYTGTPVEF